MKLNKIEGDAAFFYLQSSKPKDDALNILSFMKLANDNFKDKLSKLQFVQSCPCDPCQQARNLSLKIVVHHGDFHITKIRDFTELSGENVILIHRLLKNSIKSNEYWLFTKQFSKFLEKFVIYSHSIVPGGLLVISYTPLLTESTSFTILFAILSKILKGIFDQSAVIPSSLDTQRKTIGHE